MDTDTTPAPTSVAAPVAPTPAADLNGLAALIAAERSQASTASTTDLLATTGFATLDELTAYVADRREAEQAAMSEVERREAAAQATVDAATAANAAAQTLIRNNTVTAALLRAGVAPDNVAVAVPLVQLGDDLSDATVDGAVLVLRNNPAFASLFAPAAPAAPSGHVPGAQAPTNQPPVDLMAQGAAAAEARNAQQPSLQTLTPIA